MEWCEFTRRGVVQHHRQKLLASQTVGPTAAPNKDRKDTRILKLSDLVLDRCDLVLNSVGNGSVVNWFGPAVRGAVRDWFGLVNHIAWNGSQCRFS